MSRKAMESGPDGIPGLRESIEQLRARIVASERKLSLVDETVPDANRESVRNLTHYLALRSEDLRPLQNRLTERGLSSLGRCEPNVLDTVDAVLGILERAESLAAPAPRIGQTNSLGRNEARKILESRTDALFGPTPGDRSVRIMVTAPDEAPRSFAVVKALVESGMNCLRINCAHGDAESWKSTIENVRRAELETGRTCRVLMDLAGPRARTGAIRLGPAVLKIRPRRDTFGWVTRPANVWLTAAENPLDPEEPADAVLTLPGRFLARLHPGDRLRLEDARKARRVLTLVATQLDGCWARLEKTAYLTNGTRVVLRGSRRGRRNRSGRIGGIDPLEQSIGLREGDRLVLTRDQSPGRGAIVEADGTRSEPARIPIVPQEVLRDLRVGEPIWIDDGRIGGRIVSVDEEQAVVLITSASLEGAHLGTGKGINLPESDLRFPSLTAHDIANLPFIVEHADLLGYSFVRTAQDIEELYRRLAEIPGTQPGVILKIETRQAFAELPSILLEALRHTPAGVMIARGDLAVECGFERLAEVQEEILWLCEAAHLPVIWATQVLEGLAKRGLASRAEITDAAVGVRAECVMLNKGPYIVETVGALDRILEQMQDHQEKKRTLLRHLRVVDRLLGTGEVLA